MMVLNNELSKLKRTVSIQNFNSASIVGIIFYASHKNRYKKACDFIDFVKNQGLKVYGIGIVDKEAEIVHYPHVDNVNYFGLDKVNWYDKPTNKKLTDYCKIQYDILIDISMSDVFTVKYIFAKSNSIFKITNSGAKEQYADFVIQLQNSDKIEDYIKYIIHYLQSINIK